MITYIIWDEDIDDYDDWNGDCYDYVEDYGDDMMMEYDDIMVEVVMTTLTDINLANVI